MKIAQKQKNDRVCKNTESTRYSGHSGNTRHKLDIEMVTQLTNKPCRQINIDETQKNLTPSKDISFR